jgi:RNA polymerase sigma-70 factor (ECF subfamily)
MCLIYLRRPITVTRTDQPDTEELLRRAAAGDAAATGQLLQRHRKRLRRMVAVRMDPRLAARVDPSDVVQETLAGAARRLPEYLRDRPLPFYPWLRRLATDCLLNLLRLHVRARKRSVEREEPPALPDESALELADRLFARGSSPSAHLQREERRQRVRAALEALSERDREVLVLRHLEELPPAEIAAVLGLSEGAVYTRHLRALRRLRRLLGPDLGGGEK